MPIGVQISTFIYAGTAQLGDVFGFYQAPSSVQVQRLQLSSQVAAVGGNIGVELVNLAGTVLAEVVMLSASNYKDYPLPAPITLSPGQAIRARISETDLGVAQYFTLNVIGATAQFPVGPCCCGP